MRPRGAFYRFRFWIFSALIGCMRFAVSCALAVALIVFAIVLGSQIFVFARDGDWRPVSAERLLQIFDVDVPGGALAAATPAALVLFAAAALLFIVRKILRTAELRRDAKARGDDRDGIIDDMERALQTSHDR
jgi:hypothetical protein